MPENLHKADRVRGDPAVVSPLGEADAKGAVTVDMPQGPAQLDGKLLVAHGLEQIIQRIHRVPLHRVPGDAGNEEDHQVLVSLPDRAGHVDAVGPAHLHIEKEQIEGARLPQQQILTVGEGGDGIFPGFFPKVSVQIGTEPGKILFIVIHGCDTQHTNATFLPCELYHRGKALFKFNKDRRPFSSPFVRFG